MVHHVTAANVDRSRLRSMIRDKYTEVARRPRSVSTSTPDGRWR